MLEPSKPLTEVKDDVTETVPNKRKKHAGLENTLIQTKEGKYSKSRKRCSK
jgi:hypothetical protein